MFAGKRKVLAITAALAIVAIGGGAGAGIVVAGGGDDDQPLTDSALENASKAVLEEYPDGTIIETEVGDDGAAYGVEVRLGDGSVVEVHLDEGFNVIGQEADDDGAGETDAGPDN